MGLKPKPSTSVFHDVNLSTQGVGDYICYVCVACVFCFNIYIFFLNFDSDGLFNDRNTCKIYLVSQYRMYAFNVNALGLWYARL